jgi:hypothetical protein
MSMMRIGLQMQAAVGYLACGTAFFIRSSSTPQMRASALNHWRLASPPRLGRDGYAELLASHGLAALRASAHLETPTQSAKVTVMQ